MNTLLGLAVLPVVALLYYIWIMDPEEKEPPRLLASLVALGVLSTIVAIVLENAGSLAVLGEWHGSQVGYLMAENFIVVALVEELCKFVILRVRTWNHEAFDYMFDGIVYAVFVSLGFAVAENISYVFEYGLGTGIVRAFTAVPGHCLFAIFMGYFYSRARRSAVQGKPLASALFTVASLAVPVFLHGTYDFLASIEGMAALGVFFVFLAAMCYTGFRLVKRESARAERLNV